MSNMKKIGYFILSMLAIFHFSGFIRGNLLVTKLGILKGVELPCRGNKTFTAYFGVPFAKQPVGNLRFKPPVEVDKWNGTFDATRKPKECSQIPRNISTYGTYEGVEDCVFVNIYTPKNATAGDNYPVMYYISGGMFKYGTTLRDGPQYFMRRDLVIVFVSSRLGVFGYLSTGDNVVSGNMGLKDQVLALKWTKRNIYDFGGNPDQITIAGHSTGAASIHLLTLSPLIETDLYQRVIMQSGLALNPQSFMDQDTARSLSKNLGRAVNCPTNSSQKLVECLMTKSAEELVTVSNTLVLWQDEPSIIFRPTIEDKSVENAFLTEHPVFANYTSMDKPWLLGMTSGEAAAYLYEHLARPETYNMELNLLLPISGVFLSATKPSYLQHVQQTIKTHYFDGDERLTPSKDLALVEVVTGTMHGNGLLNIVQKYRGTKYLYLYDYRSGYSNQLGKFRGVAHADEIPLMWFEPTGDIKEGDLPFGDEMNTRWVNFIYSGDPNIPHPINRTRFGEWYPVTTDRLEFLRINEKGTMEADYFQQRFGFWQNLPLFSKYYT